MYISKTQHWHMEPPWGLLNDPNGLIWYKGNYHAYFQWNRFAKDHSSKAWGWCVSPDLVHWRFRGSALVPDQPYDAQGVYSGSAIDVDGRLCLYYTGNVKQNGHRISSQCLAVSEDGVHYQKYGPILATPSGYTQHFRDPKVSYGSDGGYRMVLGAQQDSGFGAVPLFTSLDGLQWTYSHTVGTSQKYQMIECPDLFLIDGAEVLLYCPQYRDNVLDAALSSFSVYKVLKPVPETEWSPIDLNDGWRLLDDGFDFYAPQTFLTPDGRRILLGWMSRMEGDEEVCFAAREPRIHCLTMPRELFLRDNQLCQRPVRELQQLSGIPVEPEHQADGYLYCPTTRAFRFTLNNQLPCGDLSLKLNDGEWGFHYDASAQQIEVRRRRWADAGEDVRSISLDQLTGLDLWCDQSSVELFVNDGEYVFSARTDPSALYPSLLVTGMPRKTSAQLTLLPDNLYQYLPKEEEKP